MSFSENLEALTSFAARIGAAVLPLPGGGVVVALAKPSEENPEEHLSISEAASIAKISKRTLKEGLKRDGVVLYGSERTRTVKRRDLMGWIESRKAPVVKGEASDAIERRMARIERESEGGAK